MKVKREVLFFKNGYELKSLTQEQAENMEIGNQVYLKKNGIAYPCKITECFEGANIFKVE